MIRIWPCVVLVIASLGSLPDTMAEPYLAVKEGLACSSCHTNRSGGGMRSSFGQTYGTMLLPRNTSKAANELTNQLMAKVLSIGGDLRSDVSYTDDPNADDSLAFDLERLQFYLHAKLIPNVLELYVDQHLAPNSSNTREAFALLKYSKSGSYLKTGRFYPAYGWRILDDEAFIRRDTGMNFNLPDEGLEVGWEKHGWVVQSSITNGGPAGREADRGKQVNLLTQRIYPYWRLGFNFSYDDAESGSRTLQGILGSIKTGNIVWLGEINFLENRQIEPEGETWLGLLQVNWLVDKGYNLRAQYEFTDADIGDNPTIENFRQRYSLVGEYTPFPYIQLRTGLRFEDNDDPQIEDITKGFAELHLYF